MSQPYQSRILRQVLQTSQRWAETSRVAWRTVQRNVSWGAAWGANVLLSPFWAAFRAGERVGFQVKGQAQRGGLGEGPTPSNTPGESAPGETSPAGALSWLPRSLQALTKRLQTKPNLPQVQGQGPEPAISPAAPLPALASASTPISTPISTSTPTPTPTPTLGSIQSSLLGFRSKVLKLWSGKSPLQLKPDRAIQQALLSVNLLLLSTDLPARLDPTQLVSVPPTPTTLTVTQPNAPVVRGIASDLQSRSLVLVSDLNQVLTLLSPAQQDYLQQQIDQALGSSNPSLRQLLGRGLQALGTKFGFARLPWAMAEPQTSNPNLQPRREREMALAPDSSQRVTSPMIHTPEVQSGEAASSLASLGADPWNSPWDLEAEPLEPSRSAGGGALPGGGSPTQRQITADATSRPSPLSRRQAKSAEIEWASPIIDLHPSFLGYLRSPWEKFLRACDRLLTWLEHLVFALKDWVRSL